MIGIFETLPAPSENFQQYSEDFPMWSKILEDFVTTS